MSIDLEYSEYSTEHCSEVQDTHYYKDRESCPCQGHEDTKTAAAPKDRLASGYITALRGSWLHYSA